MAPDLRPSDGADGHDPATAQLDPAEGGAALAIAFEVAAEAGCTAVIHPGGSKGDEEVLRAAEAHGMAVVLTGTRHFRH